MGGNRIVCQILAFVHPKVVRGLNGKMRGAALKAGFRSRRSAVAHKEGTSSDVVLAVMVVVMLVVLVVVVVIPVNNYIFYISAAMS